jgi:enoyl-CoA hydratase/carnithine racemase
MLLLGEPLPAHRAREIGLVNEVLPDTQVFGRALAKAHRLATQPPESVLITKRLLKQAEAATVERAMAAEVKLFFERLTSAEAKEAFQAFLEKRKPDFSRFN